MHPLNCACPDCDLLLSLPAGSSRRQRYCPRCNASLGSGRGSFPALASTALAGLILFFPAVTLPLMRFTLAGQSDNNSVWEGIADLWQQGFPLLAVTVMVCSLLAPLVQLLVCFSIACCVQLSRFPAYYPSLLKIANTAKHWSMLEVYAIGILVAYVKMMGDGDVTILSGCYCLAAVMVCAILSEQLFDNDHAWAAWQQGKAP
ncbi:MAG: paraquat-inducible protein A [Spongiibacter sp.]|nr:paraquat-inducible protein A [Spongiibacter thalassae]MDX1505223.1 paraquat-inducible protein A [Spongiibacter sp.]